MGLGSTSRLNTLPEKKGAYVQITMVYHKITPQLVSVTLRIKYIARTNSLGLNIYDISQNSTTVSHSNPPMSQDSTTDNL